MIRIVFLLTFKHTLLFSLVVHIPVFCDCVSSQNLQIMRCVFVRVWYMSDVLQCSSHSAICLSKRQWPGAARKLYGNVYKHMCTHSFFIFLSMTPELSGNKAILHKHTHRDRHIWLTLQTYSQLSLGWFMSINLLSERTWFV